MSVIVQDPAVANDQLCEGGKVDGDGMSYLILVYKGVMHTHTYTHTQHTHTAQHTHTHIEAHMQIQDY